MTPEEGELGVEETTEAEFKTGGQKEESSHVAGDEGVDNLEDEERSTAAVSISCNIPIVEEENVVRVGCEYTVIYYRHVQ